jgi:hypothetical protein
MDIVAESLAIAEKTTASSKRSATQYDPQLHLSNRWPVELHQWPSIIILTSDTKLDFQTDYIDDVDVIITAESLALWHSQLGPPNQTASHGKYPCCLRSFIPQHNPLQPNRDTGEIFNESLEETEGQS